MSIEEDIEEAETIICYVVIADTGAQYFSLREVMFTLRDSLGWEIDTMGRTYISPKI